MGKSSRVGLKAARQRLITALKAGTYLHEDRKDQAEANLLMSGVVTPQQVIQLVNACRGDQYEESRHDRDRSIPIYIMKPIIQAGAMAGGWYVKFYFAPGTVFISVHRQRSRHGSV